MVNVAVLLPGDNIGKVIGKQGAGLRTIRETSGCKIVVQAAGADRSATRRIDLIGQPINVGHATGTILSTAFHGQSSVQATVLIPDKCTGAVIGRGGENLKRVRESTGVRIQVEREFMLNPVSGDPERMLTFVGEPTMCGNGLGLALGATGSLRPAPLPGLATFSGGAAVQSQPPEVHAMGDDPDAVQVHLVIPGKLSGAIVGKGGAAIQQLAAQAGCRLSMSARNMSADRRVICIGSPPTVIAGQQLVHNAALQACDASGVDKEQLSNVTAICWIPKEASGAVIGKSGSTLARIREQTQVALQFGKEEARQMRPCSITGSLQNVITAESMIFEVLSL